MINNISIDETLLTDAESMTIQRAQHVDVSKRLEDNIDNLKLNLGPYLLEDTKQNMRDALAEIIKLKLKTSNLESANQVLEERIAGLTRNL